ncbi:pentatricopeptide repeat-containing protein PNM1, mitochondrial [Impatiens glandulifera]|uniref:pentatricopeptide repeat-containing protein PNM1, mitochondrial n=1 Tax=Impatiens glandulifera TaxID=253017 RepID=UPI001FB050C1|nr:pentatricopeptide repeat-containing protein PNM1, mitochondrial [Impatiens glandulifera]XP_047327276.1 pentatricopeptide repeat-containing protein PNM1, mitochondrial [Impatiens glandulifera]
MPPPVKSQQLRALFLRRVSSSYRSSDHPYRLLPLLQHSPSSRFLLSPAQQPHVHFFCTGYSLASSSRFPSFRLFSSDAISDPIDSEEEIAKSISSELIKDPESDSLSLNQRLDLNFSHITLTPSLILRTLNVSPEAGRSVLEFHKWVFSRPNFKPTDEMLSYFVNYLGRRKDFKAVYDFLVEGRGVVGDKSLEASLDRLVRAGRPTQAVSFFEKMEKEYGFPRNRESLNLIVSKLCEFGFASYAEKLVKSLANEIFPDEYICDTLIKGWSVDGKLEEAKRLTEEMTRGGFEIGPGAYNAILDCVCKLCRKKDPLRLHSEAEKILIEMDVAGIPRNTETFNVLITNLCKIRKTGDSLDLFHRMGEWGCHPNETTFLVLIRSLYQAARIGEGDEMIDRMKSAGFGNALDKKAYYGFVKILCGIERIEHALTIFGKMKDDGCVPGIKTYELLIKKFATHDMVEKANALFKEAANLGLPVESNAYKLDPRFVKEKKPRALKKEKKRETLPEKMARKRSRLKKIRLSYVKKPKKGAKQRAY